MELRTKTGSYVEEPKQKEEEPVANFLHRMYMQAARH